MKQIIVDIAKDLGVPANTVAKWKERGAVPHRHRLPMISAARKIGKRLVEADFEWSPGRKEAA